MIHQFVKGVAIVPTFGTVDEILPSSFEDENLLLPLRFPRSVLTIFVFGELGEIPSVLLCWLSGKDCGSVLFYLFDYRAQDDEGNAISCRETA